MDKILNRILRLMEDGGVSAYKLEKEAGLSPASVAAWKAGRNKPSLDAVRKIADYFGVSMDYLMDRASNISPADALTTFEVLATIRAGYDGSIDEVSTGEKVQLPTSMLHGRPASDYFTLKVTGNSMYPRILEGDTILCLRTDSVDSGDIAVLIYDGEEATVKKVNYRQGEDWLELVPFNPEYPVKRIEGEDLELCRVQGKVIKLIRDM